MKDIKLEDVLPINAMRYFNIFIATPDFKFQYLVAKAHSDIAVGPWTPCSTPGMLERVSNFSTNLSNNALVKKLTVLGSVCLKVTETQRYYFTNEGDLHVLSTMAFGGSSLAENFSSEIEWVIHTLPNSCSDVKCFVKTEYKGFMFKGLIEKYVHQAACDSFHNYLKAVREKISLLQENETHNDQSVPSQVPHIPPSASPVLTDVEDDDDDEEDDVFYDSVEMAPPPAASYLPSSSSPIPPASTPAYQPAYQQDFPRPSPLTATLPSPFSSTSHNHVIFTTYNAGRPALSQGRTLSPPPAYYPPPPPTSSLLSNPISSLPTTKPLLRGWEAASDAERREVEDYKQRFAQMVAQTRAREREWDERLLRITQKFDAHTRRTRWILVAIASFAVIWPGLARAILRLLTWLWPLVRNRVRK